MSDIFISYAGGDRDRVVPLIRALERTGWMVFWDRSIPAGTTWRQKMHSEIQTCRSVLVVWTTKSVNSEWVLEEAEIGKRKQVLVPVLLDEVDPPLGFGLIQAANLAAWEGNPSDPSFLALASDIAQLLKSAPVIGSSVKGEAESACRESASPGQESRADKKNGHPAEAAEEEKTRPFVRALLAGVTKSADWFKRITGILLATLLVGVSLIVFVEVWLGWDLSQAEISVIVFFVWIMVMAFTAQRTRWKWKPFHVMTKLRSHRSFLLMLGTAAASSSLFACLGPEKLSVAAESITKVALTCVPDRPIAYPGEKLAITAWIDGAASATGTPMVWTSSVGKIAGNSGAIWTFPNDDARISIEAPATAKARLRQQAADQCEVRVFFVRSVGMRGESPTQLLSGRTFLLPGRKEPEGYGLYSYILFGSPAGNDIERERYLKGIESYLQIVQPIEELERYRDAHELNITLIPLKGAIDLNRNLTDPKQARELAVKLLGIYDYARAQVLLADFGLDATSSGPFLVSKRFVKTVSQADRTVFDMSGVEPALVWQHTKAFCNLATQESTWTETTLRRLALNVRNVIAVAARITPQVKGEVDGLVPGAR